MTIPELCQLVSIEAVDGDDLDESAIIDEDDIARSCSSLVRRSSDSLYFEFAHYSVREFLSSESLQNPSPAYSQELRLYAVEESSYQRFMAAESLRFIQLSGFKSPYENVEDDDKHRQWVAKRDLEFPLYAYAAVNWVKNARNCLDDPRILELAKSCSTRRRLAASHPGFFSCSPSLGYICSPGSRTRAILRTT